MAKKFFNNRVYNTKRNIINIAIIAVCVIGIILCFVFTSNFQGENLNKKEANLSIKNEVVIEVNEDYTNDIFFSEIDNFDINNVEIKYPDGFDKSVIGKYKIAINIEGKDYQTYLNIIDTIKPELTTKNLNIKEGTFYTAKSFVKDCSDNSGHECEISFYKNGIDEEGNVEDYSGYSKTGKYTVKISATDKAGNETVKEAILNITKNDSQTVITPPVTTCKYGDSSYDTNEYVMAVNVSTNGCAVNRSFIEMKEEVPKNSEILKILENEDIKIKKELNSRNLLGIIATSIQIDGIPNKIGGLVGYQIRFIINITTSNGIVETIEDYKVDINGKRIYSINKYKLAQ